MNGILCLTEDGFEYVSFIYRTTNLSAADFAVFTKFIITNPLASPTSIRIKVMK